MWPPFQKLGKNRINLNFTINNVSLITLWEKKVTLVQKPHVYYVLWSKKNTIIYSSLWNNGNSEAFRWPRRDFYGSKDDL